MNISEIYGKDYWEERETSSRVQIAEAVAVCALSFRNVSSQPSATAFLRSTSQTLVLH